MSIDLTQHELALIQSPSPTCSRDQVSYPRDIAPFWRNHLHVYTAVALEENTGLEHRSERQDAYVTAFIVPKLFVFDRKYDSSRFVPDEDTGHFVAIKTALHWFIYHSEQEVFPNVAIFTPSEQSLNRIGGLCNQQSVQDDEQEFLDDLMKLTRLGTAVAFAWIPPNADITPYKFVAEYSKAWFTVSLPEGYLSYRLYHAVWEEPGKTLIHKLLSKRSNYISALTFQKFACKASVTEHTRLAAAFQFPYPLLHHWHNHLFVYTDVTKLLTAAQAAPKKYETCVYIPELGKCYRKSNWLTVRTLQRASVAAVHFAMRLVSELDLGSRTKVVFFTENHSVLRNLLRCESNSSKLYNHVIKDGIQCLRDKNIKFCVALYPPKCLLLRTVIEFYEESATTIAETADVEEFDTGLLTTFQSDVACVQFPSSKLVKGTDHSLRKIPSLWPTYMSVYVADVVGDENCLVISLYIPQLELYERVLKSRVQYRKFATLRFAIQRLKALGIEERDVVIFSDSMATLTNLVSELQNHPDKKCADLISEVESLTKTGRKIVFSWIPQDERIAGYARAVEFAKAWKYDDYDNKLGSHWQDHLIRLKDEENVVSSKCIDSRSEHGTMEQELPWFQQPPKTLVGSRSDYFMNKVLPYWHNYLHVYTNAMLENDSTVHFTVACYIPELNILQKKSKYMNPYDDNSAQMLALDVAMERLRTCSQRNLVFFNRSKNTLDAICHALNHKNLSTYAKDLVNSIRYLMKMKKSVAFAWIPPDLQIPQYKTLVQHLTDPLEGEETSGASASANGREEYFMEPAEESDWMLVEKSCERNIGQETTLSNSDVQDDEEEQEEEKEEFYGDDYDFDASYFQGKSRLRCLMNRVL